MPPEAAAVAGWLVEVAADGTVTPFVDIAGFEGTDNPEPTQVDSNPFSVEAIDGGFLVADAGGNDLLKVDESGTVSLVAAFPPFEAEFPATARGHGGHPPRARVVPPPSPGARPSPWRPPPSPWHPPPSPWHPPPSPWHPPPSPWHPPPSPWHPPPSPWHPPPSPWHPPPSPWHPPPTPGTRRRVDDAPAAESMAPAAESMAPAAESAAPSASGAAAGEMVTLPVEWVPTSVVVGLDGAYYVGQLTGGPFPVGKASVLRIDPPRVSRRPTRPASPTSSTSPSARTARCTSPSKLPR